MIQFKDINVGDGVYYLDKVALKTGVGAVKSISAPHFQSSSTGVASMAVDVMIAIDGCEKLYTMQDCSSIAYAGDLVLATESTSIVNECTKLRDNAKESLDKVDYFKLVVEGYDGLVAMLCPERAEMKEMDDRLTRLEASINEILKLIKEKDNG